MGERRQGYVQKWHLWYNYYYYIRLTAFFQDSLGNPAPERQTILDLLVQEMME